MKGKITWPIEPYPTKPGGATITHIDDIPWAECSKEKQRAALAALHKDQTKGEKSKMNDPLLVTLDQVKDLIKVESIKASDLFSIRQMKDAIRDQEAVEKARAEEHEKILAEGEKSIADGKRFQAAMDKIDAGSDKGPAVGGGKGGDAELPDNLNPAKNPMIKIGE